VHAAFALAKLLQTLREGRNAERRFWVGSFNRHEHTNPPHALGLVCAHRERPRCRRSAEKRDEFSAFHSITSSALTRIEGGIVRPSVFAVIGIGIETADMLVQEILSRNVRDRRAVADESGQKRREKGLARSGNARVRRGMIQLAWRFLEFQKDSALAKWFRERTENARGSRKKMIVALARKLLIALWHFVHRGVVPEGIVLRPAH
jgi:hypothetical protein